MFSLSLVNFGDRLSCPKDLCSVYNNDSIKNLNQHYININISVDDTNIATEEHLLHLTILEWAYRFCL